MHPGYLHCQHTGELDLAAWAVGFKKNAGDDCCDFHACAMSGNV